MQEEKEEKEDKNQMFRQLQKRPSEKALTSN
jgi:hypothetical protein